MHLREFAFVMCRLLALGLLVALILPLSGQSFLFVALDMLTVGHYGAGKGLFVVLVLFVMYGVPALLLWWQAPRIARWLAPFDATPIPTPRTEAVQTTAFSIVGLWFVVQAFYQAFSMAFLYFWRSTRPIYEGEVYFDVPRVAGTVLLFAMGSWLLLGSRRLVAFLRYLRYAR